MPLTGDVKTFPLLAIVRMIHSEKKTGLLTVTGDGRGCRIYFKEGNIIFTSGTLSKDLRLGELLKANNLIGDDTLQQMLNVARAMDKRLGAILIERGYLSRENLERLLLHQFKEMITKTLTWESAEFTYTDGLDGYIEDVQISIDPVRLMVEAQKWKDYRKIIPSDNVVFEIKPGALKSKSIFSGGVLRVLLLIDGRRSVSQIIAETGHSRLAVYRALASLVSMDAIGIKEAPARKQGLEGLEYSTILSFYFGIVELIMADLSSELGSKKAANCLQGCLKQASNYSPLFNSVQVDQGLAAAARQLHEDIGQRGRTPPREDIIKGFNQLLLGLLREEYRLLGSKATSNTVASVKRFLGKRPANEAVLARAASRYLSSYVAEGPSQHAPKSTRPAIEESSLPRLNLDDISGAAIVTFYSQMLQAVMEDLKRELGAKARDLFQGTVENSKYCRTLLSQFSLDKGLNANIARMREHLDTHEVRLSKQDLLRAFQEVLIHLLDEEQRLLGVKATQATIGWMVEQLAEARTQNEHLADYLSAFLASRTDRM